MSSTHDQLESAGRNLWNELEAGLSGTLSDPPRPALPVLLDLRLELGREKATEALEEILQHLRDLGYLKGKLESAAGNVQDFTRWHYRPEDAPTLIAAMSGFRDDCLELETLGLLCERDFPDQAELPLNTDDPLLVSSREIHLLRTLTSLDGGIRFRDVPAEGEISLRVRMIHHWLRTYGVLPDTFTPGQPYGSATSRALDGLCSMVQASSLQSLLDELADFSSVAMRFARLFEGKTLKIPAPVHDDWRISISMQRTAIRQYWKDHARILKHPETSWTPPDLHVFATRFLQVYLWHRGHYLGEIDGIWGPQSQLAMETAATIHGGNDLKNPSSQFVDEREGYLWVRVTNFIRTCESRTTRPATRSLEESTESPAEDLFALQDAIARRIGEMKDPETNQSTLDEQEALVWKRLFDAVDETTAAQRDNPVARRNFGIGMITRGVDRILEKLKRFVVEVAGKIRGFVARVGAFIDELLGNLTGAALQAFRFLQRGLARVTRIALLAGKRLLRFITGEPFVTVQAGGNWIATRFSLDQDAVSFCGPAVTFDACGNHISAIREENQSLEVVLKLGVAVLGLAAGFVPPIAGWKAARLALSVFRETWKVIHEEKKRSHDLPAGWDESALLT